MKFKKIAFFSAAAIFLTGLSLNTFASSVPEGEYSSTSQITAYNFINDLKADKSGITINGKQAHESGAICADVMPGGTCSVNIEWMTRKNNKPFLVKESVQWTSGVLQTPRYFDLKVIDHQGHQIQRLNMVR